MRDEIAACEIIEHLPFTTGPGIGARARIGLVVLASDYTVEHEFRKVFTAPGFGPGVDYYEARIRNSPQITPETLAAMGPLLTDTVDLILPGAELDVVAFGCTSAAMELGEEVVFEEIRKVRPAAKCTTPITAACAAFDAFKAKRIGVLTPYTAEVNKIVADYIVARGYQVPVFGSFNEGRDSNVARITPASVEQGVREIIKQAEVEAIFVSCTSVRLMEACAGLEQNLGIPLTSSNHAMAWHALRLAGIEDSLGQFGSLYELPLLRD